MTARAHITRKAQPDLIVVCAALVVEEDGSLTVLDQHDQPLMTVAGWHKATLTPNA